MKWISIDDQLPEIPEGYHAVIVLCSVHDPIYEEIDPGNGSETMTALWDGKQFKTMASGGNLSWSFYPIMDIVTHWMYYPKPFQITDKGFTFKQNNLLTKENKNEN